MIKSLPSWMDQWLTRRPMVSCLNKRSHQLRARLLHLIRAKNMMKHLWFKAKGNHGVKQSRAETMQTVLMLDI